MRAGFLTKGSYKEREDTYIYFKDADQLPERFKLKLIYNMKACKKLIKEMIKEMIKENNKSNVYQRSWYVLIYDELIDGDREKILKYAKNAQFILCIIWINAKNHRELIQFYCLEEEIDRLQFINSDLQEEANATKQELEETKQALEETKQVLEGKKQELEGTKQLFKIKNSCHQAEIEDKNQMAKLKLKKKRIRLKD